MNALDAVTAHGVVSELGTLVSRESLSHGTRFPRYMGAQNHDRANQGVSVWARLVDFCKRVMEERALARQLAGLSGHLLRDIGLDPVNLPMSVEHRVQHALEQKAARNLRERLLA